MNMSKKRSTKNPFSYLLMVVIITVFIVSAVFAVINFSQYEDNKKSELLNNKEREMAKAINYVVSSSNIVKSIAKDIRYNWYVIKFNSIKVENNEYQNEIIKLLRTRSNSHVIIKNMALIYKHHDNVMTSREGWIEKDEFYDAFLLDMDTLEQYSQSGELSPVREVTNSIGEKERIVSYIIDVYSSGNETNGYIEINLDANRILDMMDTEQWEFGGDLYVMDSEGGMIADNSLGRIKTFINNNLSTLPDDSSVSKEINYNGKLSMLVLYKDSHTGWIFVSVTNALSDWQTAPMNWLKNASVLLFCVTLVAMVALFLAVWHNIYRPFRIIVGKLSDVEKTSNIKNSMNFEYIGNTLESVISANNAMKDAYLESILVGGREYSQSNRQFGEWDPGYFISIVFSVKMKVKEHLVADVDRYRLKQMINESMTEIGKHEDACRYLLLPDYEMAFLLKIDNQAAECLSMVRNAINTLNGTSNYIWAAAKSKVNSGLEQLHQSYIQCREAIAFRYFHPEEIWFDYEELSKIKRDFYTVDSVQMSILNNNLLSLNFEGARKTIHDIANTIMKMSNVVFYDNIHILFIEIFYMIMKALRANHLPTSFLQTSQENTLINQQRPESLETELSALDVVLDQATKYIEEKSSGGKIQGTSMTTKFREYVERNYDKDISLSSMEMAFNMTRAYVSNKFKEKMGVSFVKYLTQYRIEKAKEMLRNDDIKIADIAEKLKMGNAQSFIRVFKKYEGVTPGQYRDTKLG